MEPVEVEFLAEKQLITIVPNFSENKLCLISVSYSKFRCINECICALPAAGTGRIWPIQSIHAHSSTTVAGP